MSSDEHLIKKIRPLKRMEVPLLPYLIGLVGLLILSGFFSGSETALCALTRVQIEKIRLKRGKASAIVNFVDNPRRLFITVLLGNNLVNVTFAILVLRLVPLVFPQTFEAFFPYLAIALSVLPMLIFGEMAPKTYAIKHPELFAKITAPPLWAFSVLISPVRALLRKIIDKLIPIFGGHPPPEEEFTTTDLQEFFKTYHEETLPPDEREIVSNILQLRDIEAKEIMVPRTEVIAVPTSNTIQDTLTQAKEFGFSRIPVYREQIDKICGIFYVKDFPQWHRAEVNALTIDEFLEKRAKITNAPPDAPLIREPFLVLETRKIGILLLQLQREQTKIAILRDEYGGISGIVTTEDIVEQVVGDIADEHDKDDSAPKYIKHSEDPLVIETTGRMSIRELNQQFELKIQEDDADTIGGYALGLFGHIPSVGEVHVNENGIEFEITATEGNLITGLFIRVPTPEEPNNESVVGAAVPLKILLLSLFLIGAGSATQTAILIASFGLAVLVCLVLSAFYSGSETALVSVNKIRMNQLVETNDAKAKIIHRLVESPDKMLALTLVGTNLANVLISQFGDRLTETVLSVSDELQGVISIVYVTVLLLIFGEILPKTIFRVKADALSLRYAYPLRLSEYILAPLIYFVQSVTKILVRIIDRGANSPSPDAQREELRLLATMGERSGNLLTEQRQMIHRLLNFQNRTVRQVMMPLVDIVAIEKNTTCEDFLQIAADSGYSRIPVYDERIYDIVGIVNLLDVIYAENRPETVEPFIRTDIHVVPESKNINALLKEIQNTQHTMVFAVDEYSGIVGLVTVEDLIEEIVGEFADERDDPDSIHLIAPDILECEGRTEIEILEEHYGLSIPQGDYETIAGYILERTGTIPETGTELELGDAVITILDADTRAIKKIRIRRRLGRFNT
ncbi:MAG: hemolysin family protein [Candidatus Poribacteria bacterium]|nr:hemolysin family protein [Candidatus Poribacteria bacterium]